MDNAVVELAAAIEALRAELTDAFARGQNERMQFRLDPVELTVQAVVTKDAGGKVGWSVLGVGGSWQSAVTQTLTLRLTPTWRTEDGSLTSDFTIASVTTGGNRFGPEDRSDGRDGGSG